MEEASKYLMKTNSNNNSFYLNYKIIDNSLVVTVFPNNKSRCVIMAEKKIKRFRRLNISLKSILINLYVQILSFKDTFIITTPTTSTSTTIAVEAETTTSDPTTTITTTTVIIIINNNNNIIYFIKLRGISQGNPMEGIPQYSGGIEENDQRV